MGEMGEKGVARQWPGAMFWAYALLIFGGFVALRLLMLSRSIIVEDHDSMSYLVHMGVWGGRLPEAMLYWTPDLTPMYLALGAVLVWLGAEVELAGRVTSLVLSCIAFVAMVAIAYRYYGGRLALLTGGLMAVGWQYVWLDVSVLTEPTYIGLLYLGLLMYVYQYGRSRPLWYALPVGVVFGAVFLTRTEGIMFLVLVPVLHVVATVQMWGWQSPWRSVAAWVLVFALGFSLLAGPQIAKVSSEMGSFAINGRQAWVTILNAPGPAGEEERLRGLDFSPDTINLRYLQSDPEALAALESERGILDTPMRMAENAVFLLWRRVVQVAGLALPLSALGLFVMLRRPRAHPIWPVVLFVLAAAVPALTHTLAFRHVAFLGPMGALLAAVGLMAVGRQVASWRGWSLWRKVGPSGAVAAVLGLVVVGHLGLVGHRIMWPPDAMWDFSRHDIEPVVTAIERDWSGDGVPVIIARKRYVTYYSRAELRMTPWTDYEGLVRYAQLNGADYLFAQHSTDGAYPWAERLEAGVPEFDLLYRGKVAGSDVALYRFVGEAVDGVAGASRARGRCRKGVHVHGEDDGADAIGRRGGGAGRADALERRFAVLQRRGGDREVLFRFEVGVDLAGGAPRARDRAG